MKMPIMDQLEAEYGATVDLKPFKDREEVKTEIRDWGLTAAIFQYACFIFAALGVIGDALNMTLGLEPMSWLLLAIVAGSNAIIGHTRFTMARHLLGIETDRRKEQYAMHTQN